MLNVRSCLDESTMLRLAGGRLPEDEEAALDEHLRLCSGCSAAYDRQFDPVIEALRSGAEVVVAGRAFDAALTAALPIMRGIDRGLALHMGKIVECGSLVALPRTSDGVLAHVHQWETHRQTLEFQTDRLDIKVDDLGQRDRLGTRAKSPRWVVAFKFAAEQAITKIVHIGVQVGKTGRLTPVADLEPVPLAGTTVKRASLHNAD